MINFIANGLRHRDSREGNPRLSPMQKAGIVAAGLGIGAVTYLLFRPRKTPPVIDAAIRTPTGPAEPARGGEQRPTAPLPAPTTTAELPAEILAGGVPLQPGWTTVSWYRYPPDDPQAMWIRIDQFGIPSWEEDTCFIDFCESGILGEDVGVNHGHFGQVTGSWRWTVIAGAATPLATERLDGTFTFGRSYIYPRYDRESLESAMIDYAASKAADWIDLAYGL